MGFFSKLKKVVAHIDKGAAIAAATVPGKPGEVAQTVGVVTTIVQQIQEKPASGAAPAQQQAQQEATLVTAVAIDDHEQRMLEMEKTIQELRAALAAQSKQRAANT